MRLRSVVPSAALCTTALFLLACDPPGKPKPGEAEFENREAITDFQTLYTNNCSGCHGMNGQNGPARILNNPVYLSILPRETLKQIVIHGRPGTAMPAWAKSQGGPLTDKQVDLLVNGIYSNWGRAASAPPDAPKYAASSTGDPAHGKQLFLRDCFACHAKGGPVGPITGRDYLELVSNQMLRTSIIVGRPDLGMLSYKNLNLGKALTDQDVTDVVAYLNSLRQSPAPGEMSVPSGEQQSATGPHENESGTGQNGGALVKGNEGSGNGPGSPRHQENENSKVKGNSSQQGVK